MASRPTATPPEGGKARRTYDTLVSATRDVIADTGVFTADAVAERAGMSQATFYTYFSSKDDALAAVLELALADLDASAAERLSIEAILDTDLRTALRATAVTLVERFRADELVYRAALGRLPHSRPIRDAYRRGQAAGLAILRRFVELAQAADRVRNGDPDAMAGALLVALQGLNNPNLLHRPTDDVLDELTRGLVAMLAPDD